MDTTVAWMIIKEPRTRIVIASAVASAPLVWGGLVWVSTLSFVAQVIVGILMGIATVGSFHFMCVHRSHKRMHKAVTVAQLSLMEAPELRRIFPSSAVPSWIQHITDFERVAWINRELEEVWPFLDQAASDMMKLQLQPVLDQYKFGPIQKIGIKSVTLGKVGPMIGGIKFTPAGKNESMLEIEVDWRHGRDQKIVLEVKTVGPDFTVQVKDIVVYGVLRVIMKPLTDQIPCFGAAVLSLREPPLVDFATKFLGGDVLQLPGLDGMIDDIIRTAVVDLLVWPNRMIFPVLPGDYSFLEMKPVAYLEVKIIEAKHLLNKEMIGKSDPFVYVYVRQKQNLMQRTKTRSNTVNPTWNEDFVVDVEDPESQKLMLKVMDSDKVDAADFLGYAEIPIKDLEPNVSKDMWVKLIRDPKKPKGDDKNRGELHLMVTFKPFKKPDKTNEAKELLPPVPEGFVIGQTAEENKEKMEAGTKKDVSTPSVPESGTADGEKHAEAQQHPPPADESKVTAGGLVLNHAAFKEKEVAHPSEVAAAATKENEAPAAAATQENGAPEAGQEFAAKANPERETVAKFSQDPSVPVQ